MNSTIKKTIDELSKYSDKQLKNFLNEHQNVIVLYQAIHLQMVPKSILYKIFVRKNIPSLFSNKVIGFIFKYPEIYEILDYYGLLKKIVAYILQIENKYDLVDFINEKKGLDYLLLILTLKPIVNKNEINPSRLKEEAFCSPFLINYIRFKQGYKKTFEPEELLNIVNQRFDTRFSSLKEINNIEDSCYFFTKRLLPFVKKDNS